MVNKHTIVGPAILILMCNPRLGVLSLGEVSVDPWCEGRCLPSGMAELNTNHGLVSMSKFNNAL